MTFAFNPFTGKLDRVATAGGSAPGGTGTEIQYRSGATTFGAIAGSSVDPATGNTTFSARWISSRNSAAGAPAHTLTGTWFTGGTAESTKPHFLIEPAGTTSTSWSVNGTGWGLNAPSGFLGNLFDFQSNATSRLALASNGLLSLTGGVTHGAFTGLGIYFDTDSTRIRGRNGTELAVGGNVGVCVVSEILTFGTGIDVRLSRDAANTLAQRNGTAAQTYRIYNTFTGNTNYELGKLEWSSNVFRIGTEKGSGGGTARALEIQTDGITRSQWSRDGFFRRLQPAPVAVNTTATLTVANIQAGIITTTTAAAVDMTLPTGTNMEGGYAVHAADLASEWSIINTGSNTATIIAATDHTIVGSAAVAAGTSGRFATRRSAANTYITYRID